MPKSPGHKLRILRLMQLLLAETDETHALSTTALIAKLAAYGIAAERKTLYDDIETLRQFGLDIVMDKAYGYHVATRDFELAELKLLADAVQSSRFVTEKKSLDLLGKLERLASNHDATKLRRQVYVQNRAKSMKDGAVYVAGPVALLWSDENYYLIALTDDREGLNHYRVDKMHAVKKLDTQRSTIRFNPADYSKKVFGMYGGTPACQRQARL